MRDEAASALDRLRGLRLTLVDGAFGSDSAKLLTLAAGVLVVVAVLAWRTDRNRPLTGPLLLLAALGLAARIAMEPGDPVPGLVLAAPAFFLLALVPLAPRLRWPAVAVVLFLIAIGATIYPEGGSLQWGGRYLSPMVPLLAAAAGIGLAAAILASDARTARWLTGGVVALLAVQAVGAVVTPNEVRQDTAGPVAVMLTAGSEVFVANGGQIARLDLDGWPDRCWMAVPERAGADGIRAALETLRASGVGEAAFVGFDDADLASAGAEVVREVPGVEVAVVDAGGSGPLQISPPYRCQ